MTVSLVGWRRAAAVLALVALAGCSAEPDTAPVVVTPTSGAVSGAGSSMTPSVTDAPVTTTSPPPAATASTFAPTAVLTPEPTTTANPGSSTETTSTDAGDEPGPGTVVYRGTTYVMPPEETTKVLATAATISIDSGANTGREANDVVKALVQALKFSDRAQMEPSKDWSNELESVFEEPYRSRFSNSLELLRSSGIRAVGHISVTGTVVEVRNDKATIEACIDIRQTDLVDASGKSVASGESNKHNSRFEETVMMIRSDGAWKISDTTERRDTKC